jgi:hypothetical protein
VIADRDDARRRPPAAPGVAGQLLVGALLIEACWCALRSDVVGLVVTMTATIAVVTAMPPR